MREERRSAMELRSSLSDARARLGRDLRFRDEWIDAWLETSAAPVLFVAARERAS